VTATTQANGRAFQNGINIVAFDIKDSTDSGTVTESSIGYAQLTLVVTDTIKSVRLSEVTAVTPDPLEVVYYSNDWAYDVSATTWYNKFPNSDDTSNDYGIWSGQYDWFQNLVNVGAAWRILLQMGEDDRAEVYRIEYQGTDGRGGMRDKFKKKLPSKVKKCSPPGISLGERTGGDYHSRD
jgi:hypothetical protein